MKKHRHGGDIYGAPVRLDFSSNLNFLGMPESVKQAAIEGVCLSEHYPDPHCRRLIAALAEAEDWEAEGLICGNGAAELIFWLAAAVKPKKSLLLAPSFYEYEQALRAAGSEIVYETLREDEDFCCTDRVLTRLTEDIGVFFLCNPNNPTGQPIEAELLEKIVARCGKTNTRLVVDECFLDFLPQERQHSVKPMLCQNPQVFLLKAFTKLYAMPGLRLGYGLTADRELLEAMRFQGQPWSVSVPAQLAGVAALAETDYVREYQRLLAEERAYLKAELSALGLRLYGSHANYIFFKGETDLYQRCLEEGILIRDCGNYPGLCSGFYRIAVRSHGENRALVEVLKKATAQRREGGYGWQKQL